MISNFQKNRNSNAAKRVLIHLAGILVIIMSIALIIANVKMYKKKQEYNTQVESLKNQIQEIQSKNSELKDGIANADNSHYIEKVAREQLDFQKQGEKTVSFIIPKDSEQKSNNIESENIFQVWLAGIGDGWNLLFGKK